MPSDDDGEPDAPDINAQIAALATGLAGLQTAVTQLVTAVSDNVEDTNRRVQEARLTRWDESLRPPTGRMT